MSYNTVEAADIARLKEIAPPEFVLLGEDIPENYSHDELGDVSRYPEVVVQVHSTAEVAAVMKYASQRRLPVTVRGAGSGLVGGATPIQGGVLLDMSLMNNILELDEGNLTLTVEPGVLLKDVAAFAEAHNYMYPPDPGEKEATLGGNISTNAGGMRAVKYGATREFVRGLTVVTPDGETLRLGGKVVKNSTGYDLKDLIIGSEGTLAIITEAILRLIPLPRYTVSLLIPFNSMPEAMALVPKLITFRISPTAIEYISRECIELADKYLGKKFPDYSSPSYLLLTYDGHEEAQVRAECERVGEFAQANGAVRVITLETPQLREMAWGCRSAFLDAFKASTPVLDECDVVLPRAAVADYILYIDEVSAATGLRMPFFGHVGDGNLHIYLCQDDYSQEEYLQRKEKGFYLLYDKAEAMGGKVSGEHGIGYVKQEFLRHEAGDYEVDLMKRLKLAFDPQEILNPGKVCY